MANNLIADQPDFYVPQTSGTPAARGFTAGNTRIIYAASGAGGYVSHIPGAGINSLTTLTLGEGILVDPITSREDLDLIGGGAPLPGGGVQTPAAPTVPVTDDDADTFNFTLTPNFPDNVMYQQTLDGGTTPTALSAKPIVVGDVAKAPGQVGVRVKAIGGNNPSAWLFNTVAFTVGAGAENIVFEDTAGPADPGINIEDVGDNIWETVGESGGPHRGLDTNRKLVGDGYIQAEIDGTHKDGMFGLRLDATAEELFNTNKVGFDHATDPPDNAMYQLDAGGTGELAVTTYLPVIGDLVRIIRTGSQFKLQKSSNAGGLWTDVHTYVYSSAADMFILCSISGPAGGLVHPKGFGLTTF